MKSSIIITIDGKKEVVPKGINIYDIIKRLRIEGDIIAASVNGELEELYYELNEDVVLDFIKVEDRIGTKIYAKGLQYVYICAVKELYGDTSLIRVKHSLDKSIYTEIDIKRKVTEEMVTKIENKMRDLINQDLPIRKVSVTRKNAIEYFNSTEEFEKAKNFLHMSYDLVTLYELNDYYNYFYYTMPSSTGILKNFDLELIDNNGIIIKYPRFGSMPPYEATPKVLDVFKDYSCKMRKLGIDYVSDVNELVCAGSIGDLIQINEMLYDNKINKIADVAEKNREIKMILIAGPSSSGKTTTSKKLILALKSRGLDSFLLSTDDYFLDRDDAPVDEDGEKDFEILEALDLKLFGEHLEKLLAGKEVVIPSYNFLTGEKEFKGKPKRLKENEIIIVEGLHAINERISGSIDIKNKLKIYISPFTPLSIDRHNHLSTTDLRFIRRMVRDYSHRGHSADDSLSRWKHMRKSEEKYIYPYQRNADIILNTALIYELGVLKVYAEPLLYSIKPDSVNYEEAIRIIKFLKGFMAIPESIIPITSIIREFVGGSYFE